MLLDFTDDDRRDLALFWELLEGHRRELDERILAWAKTQAVFAPIVASMPPEMMAANQKRASAMQKKALVDGDWRDTIADAREQGTRYAKMGIDFTVWFELLRVYRVVLAPIAKAHFKGDADKAAHALLGVDRYIDIGMAEIGAAYLEAKQEIIGVQSRAIRELSTPVLQVKERLLIVPLVGVIDTDRARQVTENVLHAIRAKRARAVVIDVTGVPVVDSKVANHLMQTVTAAGLMGASVIVCGISPEIAQTLVTIGAELRGVNTAGDLQEGIEQAEAELVRRYGRLDNGAPDGDDTDAVDGRGGGGASGGRAHGSSGANGAQGKRNGAGGGA